MIRKFIYTFFGTWVTFTLWHGAPISIRCSDIGDVTVDTANNNRGGSLITTSYGDEGFWSSNRISVKTPYAATMARIKKVCGDK